MKLVFAFLFLLYSCLSFSQEKSNKLIITFQKYITGDFDNSEQVVAEIKAGKQIHPLAIHVNRVASNKIKNLPADFNGFFY